MNFYLLMALVGIPAFMAIIWIPKWQARKQGIKGADLWKAENEFRKTIVQIVGGGFLLCSLLFAWEQLKQFYISLENMKTEQISSRYSQAIELLAREEPTTKIGAIYAMEQIVRESPNYLKTVIEVLSVCVRNSDYMEDDEGVKFIRPEAQAAITVIGRIRNINDTREGNTCIIHLAKAKLKGADLRLANLSNVELKAAEMAGADLEGANLRNANLKGADLGRANLKRARLKDTNFSLATLSNAEMNNAQLPGADLSGALMQGVSLENAGLQNTHLDGADLRWSDLSGAKLDGATLWYTDLNLAKGLTFEQLSKVKTLFQVKGLDPLLRERLIKMNPGLFKRPGD